MTIKVWTRACALALACLALPLALAAQSSSSAGAIKGVVADAQGASIPGAQLLLTNTDTAEAQQQSSQVNGSYVFTLLKPGNYKLTVTKTGFSTTTLNNLKVQVATVTTTNVALKVGAQTTEVTVTGAAQAVDTSTATTGDVITGQQVVSIPLPTRNFLDLSSLQTATDANMQSAATVGRGTPIVYVAGSRGTTNDFVLDGVDANNFGSNSFGSVPVPSPDAVQEFKVSTSLYDASQGRGSGGQVNVVLKSGTDQYHGGGFEFFRSNDLNANDFFLNRAGKPRPVLLQNQFGGEMGGPAPGLKHTFWFFSYEGTRQKNGVSSLVSGSQPVMPATRDAASLATAFNVPVASIDPVAVKWLNQPGPYGGQLYPTGTCVGVSGTCGVGSIGTLTTSLPTIYNENQEAASVDHDFSSSHHLAMQWFWANASSFSPTGGGVSLGQGSSSPLGNRHLALNDRYVFSPNLLNDFTVGYTNTLTGSLPIENVNVGDIGMTKWDAAEFPGTPAVSISGLLSWGGIGVNSAQHGQAAGITLADTLSWEHGSHNVRVGGQWIRYRWNQENDYGSRGSLSFPNFASFLTGTPNRLQIDVGNYYRNYRDNSIDGFAQDDWHITRRLTLNLGLRLDNLGFPWEADDRTGNFDPTLVPASCLAAGGGNCVQAGFVAPATASKFATPGVSNTTLAQPLGNHWAPRVGFAYDVFGNGRTAIRGGYGLYYIQISGQALLQLIASAPWVQQSTASGTAVAGSGVLANPWPAGLPQPSQFPVIPPIAGFQGYNANGTANYGATPLLAMYGFERYLQAPYVEQYNLDVQTELTRGWTLETGYVGSRGLHLLSDPSQNQALLVNAANPGLGGLTANSANNASARVAIPGYSSEGLDLAQTGAYSFYNAFTLELQHPFSKSLQFKMAYTYSKSLDSDSGGSTSDLGGYMNNQLVPNDYGPSNFNQPQRLIFQYVWNVPGLKASGWAGSTLRGWSLTGIYTIQSGLPFNISSNVGGSLFGMTGYSTANAAACTGGAILPGNIENNLTDYLNKTCFATTPLLPNGTVLTGLAANGGPGNQSFTVGGVNGDTSGGTLFGSLGRNTVQSPTDQRFDLALLKDVAMPRLGEAGSLQLRVETFKLFNNVNFSAPSSVVESASFGAITSTIDGTGRIIQLGLKLSF